MATPQSLTVGAPNSGDTLAASRLDVVAVVWIVRPDRITTVSLLHARLPDPAPGHSTRDELLSFYSVDGSGVLRATVARQQQSKVEELA